MLKSNVSGRLPRASTRGDCAKPLRQTTPNKEALSVTGGEIWNNNPAVIRECATFNRFQISTMAKKERAQICDQRVVIILIVLWIFMCNLMHLLSRLYRDYIWFIKIKQGPKQNKYITKPGQRHASLPRADCYQLTVTLVTLNTDDCYATSWLAYDLGDPQAVMKR